MEILAAENSGMGGRLLVLTLNSPIRWDTEMVQSKQTQFT